ncbi:hypothetical protein [Streptomyces sp. NPDC017991]|uniref:hypothetical protein n=1 Tax=Streptomyces sp. NPDC017991 TaxID=3365026 RepID=UPI00378D1131
MSRKARWRHTAWAGGNPADTSSPDPLVAIHVAVNRIAPDAPEGTQSFPPPAGDSTVEGRRVYAAADA